MATPATFTTMKTANDFHDYGEHRGKPIPWEKPTIQKRTDFLSIKKYR